MTIVNIHGLDIYYESHGDGPAVLFIHGGYGGSKSTVLPSRQEHIVSLFAADPVRLILYDRRCCGRSEYTANRFGLEDLAAEVVGLLDFLDIQRAVVIGSSAGGPIALQLALEQPDRVLGLALPNTGPGLMCEPPAGYRGPLPEGVEFRLSRIRSFLDQVERARVNGDRAQYESMKAVLRDPPLPPGSTTSLEEQQLQHEALEGIEDEQLFLYYVGMLRNYEAYIDQDFTERLNELAMPVFLVHGNADRAVPIEYMYDLADGIPHAETHIVEGAGHGILSNAEAQRLLREWILRVI